MIQPLVVSIFAILIGGQIQPSLSSEEMNLHLCKSNKTVTVQILTGQNDDMSCKCQAGLSNQPFTREDYLYTPGIGSHKLHTVAKPWNEARQICKEENAHLAIINSKAEEKVLLETMKKAGLRINARHTTDQAYLGIHDFFKEGEWLTIFGESIYSAGYAEWSTNWYVRQPDNAGNGENCGTLVLNGGMNDNACHIPLAFFCETPLPCTD
ncbi:hemolymph lipopolysaccharide-binding protein-like [Nasonia vitripennis]|uniref:C-type lectin domain-containing protein n=1 Tax=Nasonia vitripennis TaxID=7425 RepID=A0A7M7G1A6_NASVI|nr:hemolymph lipopolysaccharide-binding protein-like [Nasonia vitripennis]